MACDATGRARRGEDAVDRIGRRRQIQQAPGVIACAKQKAAVRLSSLQQAVGQGVELATIAMGGADKGPASAQHTRCNHGSGLGVGVDHAALRIQNEPGENVVFEPGGAVRTGQGCRISGRSDWRPALPKLSLQDC